MLNYEERSSAVYEMWEKFINNMSVDHSTHVSGTTLNSWKRCRNYGVNPYLKEVPPGIQGEELDKRIQKNEHLIKASRPFMETLNNIVTGSGFTVVLFDRDGYILSIVGDEDVMMKHRKGNFSVGTCWSEYVMGTNGCGTALAENKPVQIFACEHFCKIIHSWTCSGAPIHDSACNIIGVIAMTAHYKQAHPHTLGMVVAASHAIKNLLQLEKTLSDLRADSCYQQSIFDSSQEALIAINKRKAITLLNENAKKLLDLRSDVVGKKLSEVFFEDNNRTFLNTIFDNFAIIDKECIIYRGNKSQRFTVTATPIRSSQNDVLGKIIAIDEIKRARKMVTEMIGAKADFEFKHIIGKDPQFLATIEMGRRAALSTSNVLLLGETGTGKDLFAQAIHNYSDSKNGPYIAINCGAIPRELIASELFGYCEGAFTGSKKGGNPGKFELANDGTIYLDEIGEMPLELQTLLLRVIEEKKVTRIGANKTTRFNVRIIAATNKNLRNEVLSGNFREDLYFRLNVFTIELVPLRIKKNDIHLLTDHFTTNLSKRLNKEIKSIDTNVLQSFINYSWPGNVRELQNVIERMINIAPGDKLTSDLLPSDIIYKHKYENINHGDLSLQEIECRAISELIKSNLTKEEIAGKLKIARSTLYRKIEKYGIS